MAHGAKVRHRRAASGLRRRGPRREPKRRFVLFCEGAKTEPAYFDAIRRACSSAMVSVETVPGVGVPMTVAGKAVEEAKSLRRGRKRDSFEESDQIWAVFDRDEHPCFDEAVALCEGYDVGVARSDPCFELWLILHEQDYNRSCDRHEVQRELERLRPEYDRGHGKTPDCEDLVRRVEEAEGRAKTLLRRRNEEDNPCGNPSTTVGRLTRAVRAADESARP